MTGLLLLNLGTPDAPRTREVRAYLREFLSDPRVLDMNPVGRWLLLNLIILPRRPARSAALYRKIWTERGSPLLVHGMDLASAMGRSLGDDWQVELAMRYGRPSIADALARLRAGGADRIVVFPLFPQYASATTGTALEAVYRLAGGEVNVPSLATVAPFFDHPAFVRAQVAVARPVLDDLRPDHVVMSFHGLPERQVRRADGSGHCLGRADCCASIGPHNRTCYRAQSHATARALVSALGLDPAATTVSFQSRLGRAVWIGPHTDVTLRELAARGVKRVAVLCPAFVADCLETLEEIAIRNRADFLSAGGDELRLVPSLNGHPEWVAAAVRLVHETVGLAAAAAESSAAVSAG